MAPKKENKKPTLTNVIEKPWGHEVILAKNNLYVVKQLFVKAGKRLSKQFHRQKVEHITLIAGDAYMYLESDEGVMSFKMHPMAPVDIEAGIIHRLAAGEEDAILVEVSTPELDDVIRLEDDYGRQDNLDATKDDDSPFDTNDDDEEDDD
jgi:mannose-6-phosphate isomerase